MNDLQIFNYGEVPVRTIITDGEPWWVLKDVCQVLNLSDTNKTAERLDPDELTRTKLVSGGQMREMYIVNESGLIIRLTNWKFALPLRKNGWPLAFRLTEPVNLCQHFGNGLKKLVSRKNE